MQYLNLNELDERIHTLFKEIKKEKKGRLILVTPLGAGKPHFLLNKIYQHAKNDQGIELIILTALSLSRPRPRSSIERSFFNQVSEKIFGDCPELDYVKDLLSGNLPQNVKIKEFFLNSSLGAQSSFLQRNYTSLNYSQVLSHLISQDIDLIIQMVSQNSEGGISLGPNADLTKDIIDYYKKKEKKPLFIAQASSNAPFLGKTDSNDWDYILDCKESHHQLFSTPNLPITYQHWLIGIFSSVLVKDGGTLQIGIGQTSDSICAALLLRQFNNSLYKEILHHLKITTLYSELIKEVGGIEPFSEGINICTEMMTPGLLELFKNGVAKKKLRDASGKEALLRAAFFLGSQDFYKEIHGLSKDEKESVVMESVLLTNTLGHEEKRMLERPEARFINFTMNASVFGEAISEATDDGKVVGGVGGQFDFSYLSTQLKGARNVLALKARRHHQGKVDSNIRYEGGRVTIARHLRDIFVTEYGIADLRSKTDEEVILEMIKISSPEVRESLLQKAMDAGKVSKNTSVDALKDKLLYSEIRRINDDTQRSKTFPFGSSLSETERKGFMILLLLKEEYGKTYSSIGLHLISFFRIFILKNGLDRDLKELFELDKLPFLKKLFFESLLLLAQEKLETHYPEI